MGKKSTLIAVVVVLIVVGIGIWLGLFPPWRGASGEIKIGALLPLTGSGAIYGEMARKAIDLAVEEINTGGGIKGRKVSVKLPAQRAGLLEQP